MSDLVNKGVSFSCPDGIINEVSTYFTSCDSYSNSSPSVNLLISMLIVLSFHTKLDGGFCKKNNLH